MRKYIISVIIIGLIGAGVYFLVTTPPRAGELDEFATCLKDKGALFYGAFWCPHCRNQKGLFGRSEAKLPYIECSTPNGNDQLQICKDKKITTYPTWDFSDGERITGEVSLEKLAEKTGCVLPQR